MTETHELQPTQKKPQLQSQYFVFKGSDLFSFVSIVQFSQRMEENGALCYNIISTILRQFRSYNQDNYSHYNKNRDDKSTL
jgi:hypothetical protein